MILHRFYIYCCSDYPSFNLMYALSSFFNVHISISVEFDCTFIFLMKIRNYSTSFLWSLFALIARLYPGIFLVFNSLVYITHAFSVFFLAINSFDVPSYHLQFFTDGYFILYWRRIFTLNNEIYTEPIISLHFLLSKLQVQKFLPLRWQFYDVCELSLPMLTFTS